MLRQIRKTKAELAKMNEELVQIKNNLTRFNEELSRLKHDPSGFYTKKITTLIIIEYFKFVFISLLLAVLIYAMLKFLIKSEWIMAIINIWSF